MIFAGIDAGSRAVKAVLVDGATLDVIASGSADQGVDQQAIARSLFEKLLADRRLAREEVAGIVATGCARGIVGFADTTITEITCHARGVRRVAPGAMTIIEVGGQDSKLIKLHPDGGVRDFSMSDRCAAGSGRFLEVLAARLAVDVETLGAMARRSTEPASISSMCVVFAETEIIGLLAAGASPVDLAAGIQASIAARIVSMAGRKVEPPVVFAGGVARIPGMAEALSAALGLPVSVAPMPQMTGALGAALLCPQLSLRTGNFTPPASTQPSP